MAADGGILLWMQYLGHLERREAGGGGVRVTLSFSRSALSQNRTSQLP